MVVHFVDIGRTVDHQSPFKLVFIKHYSFAILCLEEHDNNKTTISTVGHTSQENDKNTQIMKYSW